MRTPVPLGKEKMEEREWMNVVIESINLRTDWKHGGKVMEINSILSQLS